MKTSVFALALAGSASAHTTVWNILVNGKDQGVGNKQGGYIDSPPNNNPVLDVTSKAIECNVPGVKAAKSVAVNGGDEITFEWHHDSNSAGDDIIASSHKGPIMVYASKAGSSLSWTKLWEDGFSGKTSAVDKLIAGTYTGKKGQHKMTLPKLAPGDYILRPEILALHEGNRQGGAQFYMECVHVKVGGSGTVQLPAGVSFPGAYKATDPGILFNIYGSSTSYTIPGPKVWSGASAASSPATPATPAEAAPAASTLVTVVQPAATPASGSGSGTATAQKFAQCGGQGYTGATACASGTTCTKQNDYYSQCI